MRDTLHGVAKLMNDRHDGWIETGMIEIAFQEKFVPKDGDSAGLATGLMVESLVTGAPIDPGFTCTGALKGDGTVAPIGGVVAKLRGAQKFGSRLVALPSENRYALTDLTVLGQARFWRRCRCSLLKISMKRGAWRSRIAQPMCRRRSINLPNSGLVRAAGRHECAA